MRILVLSFFVSCLFVVPLHDRDALAEEISFLGGGIQERDSHDLSYSWAAQYLHDLNEHWAVTFSWLNEGHFDDHHRDGQTLQLLGRIKPFGEGFVLAAGIGPYLYYDTKLVQETASYEDSHGLGVVTSLSATWYLHKRWLFLVQSNVVETSQSFDSFSILAGIGYQFEVPRLTDHPASSSGTENEPRNEITVLGGQTIVNSFDSEKATALMLEYRRNLGRYVDWTIGGLDEGDPGPISRYGLTTELWLVHPFFDDRLTLGVGVGPYIALDQRRNPDFENDDESTVAGLVTISAAYQIRPPWGIRISWNRIVTDYDRDTDVILGGIGFRF
jgi:hypothetical protein